MTTVDKTLVEEITALEERLPTQRTLPVRHTPPRVLVTGSRNWRSRAKVALALLTAWMDLGKDAQATLVSGACPTGADRIAEEIWESWGLQVERHPAAWDKHGRAAGPMRNEEMVRLGADLCIAFPMPGSRGTLHCMAAAAAAGIPVREVKV